MANEYTVHAVGTFDSGTLTIETSPDGTNFTSVGANGVFTAANQVDLSILSDSDDPVLIRATLAGATSPDIDIFLYDVR